MAGRPLVVKILGNADGLADALDQASGQLEGFGKVAGAVGLAGGVAIGALLAQGFTSALDLEAGNAKLQAQLGITKEQAGQAGAAAGKLFAGNYGDNMEQVNDAIVSVQRNIDGMRGASAETLEGITKDVLNLTSAFGEEAEGLTRSISQLVRTGLASDVDEATDLITHGLQSNINVADDFLDTIDEYSTQFRQLGLEGEQAFGLLSQFIQAGGRDADTAADALKEFAIRATDMSKTSIWAFESIGLSADQMAQRISDGGPGAAQALDLVIQKLRAMEPSAERTAIAVALFGTKAEDAQDALYAMDTTTAVAAFGKFKGAADELDTTLGSTLAARIETLKREAMGGLTSFMGAVVLPAFEALIPLVTGAAEAFGSAADAVSSFLGPVDSLAGPITTFALGAGGVALALGGITSAVSTAASALGGFGTLLSGSVLGPIGLAAVAIGGAGAIAFTHFREKSDEAESRYRAYLDTLSSGGDPVAQAIQANEKLAEKLAQVGGAADEAAGGVAEGSDAWASAEIIAKDLTEEFGSLALSVTDVNAAAGEGQINWEHLGNAIDFYNGKAEGGERAANRLREETEGTTGATREFALALADQLESGDLTIEQGKKMVTVLHNLWGDHKNLKKGLADTNRELVETARLQQPGLRSWIDQQLAIDGTKDKLQAYAKIAASLRSDDQYAILGAQGWNEMGIATGGAADGMGDLEQATADARTELEKLDDAQNEFFRHTDDVDASVDSFNSTLQENLKKMHEIGDEWDLNTEKGRENRSMLREVRAAAADHIETLAKAGAQADVQTAALHAMADEAYTSAIRMGETADEAENIRQAILEIPVSKTVSVTVEATMKAVGVSMDQLSTIAGLPASDFGVVAKRAKGGPVRKGVPYLVGEQGPEPFIPDQDGTILPTSSLGAASGGGVALGAGRTPMTVNVNISTLATDTRSAARIIRDEIRKLERGAV